MTAEAEKAEFVQNRLDVVDEVGRDDDGRLGVVVADDGGEDVVTCGGIDAGDGLIKQVELGAAGHDHHELNLFLGAFGEGFELGSGIDAEIGHHTGSAGRVEIGEEIGKVGDQLLHAHPVAEVGTLGEVGDEGIGGLAPGHATDFDLAAVRDEDSRDELEQGGFTASVGAEQADDLTAGEADVEIVEDRLSGDVGFTEIRTGENGGVHGHTPFG